MSRSTPSQPSERRQNQTLRELLDEMIDLARHLANHAAHLPPAELDYARQRMEWLAGEIWEQATRDAPRT
ncbi:MAG: hypothetical protein ACYCVL_00805 [Gemmatimonadaceae bacterium]